MIGCGDVAGGAVCGEDGVLCPDCRPLQAMDPLYLLWATTPAMVAKLYDIKNNPRKHHHSFEDLHTCCMIDGVLILWLFDAHSDLAASDTRTDGSRCDVTSGPCSCGATHSLRN